MIQFNLQAVSDDVLDQLQETIKTAIEELQDQAMMVTAEKVNRRGGINQMAFDYEGGEQHVA